MSISCVLVIPSVDERFPLTQVYESCTQISPGVPNNSLSDSLIIGKNKASAFQIALLRQKLYISKVCIFLLLFAGYKIPVIENMGATLVSEHSVEATYKSYFLC